MLRIDGINKAQLPDDHAIHGIIKKAMKSLDDMKLPTITIEEAKRKQSRDADGNIQHSNGCWTQCSQLYRHKGVDYRIEYYESISGSGVNEKLFPIQLDFDGTSKMLKGQSNDEIFFTLFVDPQCEKVPELSPYQNEIRRFSEFSLVQKEKDLKQKVQQGRERVELESMLYGLEGNHDRLIDVCYNFNIGTQNKQDYELIEQLMNIVLMKDERGNYNRENLDKFRSIVAPENGNEEQLADLLAFLGKLIDSGIVIPHGTAAGSWYLDEGKENKLCSWNKNIDKKEALGNYFITHKDQIPIFKDKIAQLKTA
jgi:hypothetical protein